jgi:hypothetical protein
MVYLLAHSWNLVLQPIFIEVLMSLEDIIWAISNNIDVSKE